MRKLCFMRHAVIGSIALLYAAVPARLAAVESARPNMIFLLSDDQTERGIGCYGNKEVITPHLEKVLRDGVRFTNHYNTTSTIF